MKVWLKIIIIVIVILLVVGIIGGYFYYQASKVIKITKITEDPGYHYFELAEMYKRQCASVIGRSNDSLIEECVQKVIENYKSASEASNDISKKAEFLSKAAEYLVWLRKNDEAMLIIRDIEKNYPNTKAGCDAVIFEGRILTDKKKFEEALQKYNEALSLRSCSNEQIQRFIKSLICNVYSYHLKQCEKAKEICPEAYQEVVC